MVEVVHDVNSVYSERSQEQLWLLDKSAVQSVAKMMTPSRGNCTPLT